MGKVEVLLRYITHRPVSESNCAGGGARRLLRAMWEATGGERPVRSKANPFRPSLPVSLLASGETQTAKSGPTLSTRWVCLGVALWKSVAVGVVCNRRQRKGSTVVRDGMVRTPNKRSIESRMPVKAFVGDERGAEVRALIGARKLGNPGGAKGGRKVDAR